MSKDRRHRHHHHPRKQREEGKEVVDEDTTDNNAEIHIKPNEYLLPPSDPVTSHGIADIVQTPDVAVWAKRHRLSKIHTPVDTVEANSETGSPTIAVPDKGSSNGSTESSSRRHGGRIIDAANTREVEEVVEREETLTDKADMSG